MSDGVSRRRFLGTVAATGAGAAAAATAKAAPVRPPGRHGQERVQRVATFCEMCFWRCGVIADVSADGRVVRLEGNPDHPLTKGAPLRARNAGTRLLYDPDRLKYPMLRTGKRGEGQFKRITWDEALDILADKLKTIKEQHGPEAVGFFPHGIGARFMGTLLKAYGTPNSVEPSFAQCRGPRDVGYMLTFGRPLGSPSRSTSRRRSWSSSSAATWARTSSPRRSPSSPRASRGARSSSRSTRASPPPPPRRTGGSPSGPGRTSRSSSPG